MKFTYKTITSVLRLNRIIVFTVVIGSAVTSLYSVWMAHDAQQKANTHAFVVQSDGEIIPLKWVAQQENLEVEVLSHLDLFHHYFYDLDPANYESQLEKALRLGDSSVDNLYRQKRADGVYNRLLQYSLLQNVTACSSEIDISKPPYAFQTKTLFEINRGSVTDTYELISTGKLLPIHRHFPHNPHGLLITDYFEKSLKKIPHEMH